MQKDFLYVLFVVVGMVVRLTTNLVSTIVSKKWLQYLRFISLLNKNVPFLYEGFCFAKILAALPPYTVSGLNFSLFCFAKQFWYYSRIVLLCVGFGEAILLFFVFVCCLFKN